MRRVWMALGALLAVLSLVLVRATLPDDALAGVTVIGGTSTLPAGGGSGGSLDAGSVNVELFSSALQASIPFKNDSGVIEGVLYGSSAYTAAGYADGGLTDGSQNVVARGRLAFSPTAFVLEDDPDAGSTVVKAVPQFGTEIRSGNVNTTNATSTRCVDFDIPDGTTAVAWLVLAANQYDGGGVNSASYVRLGTFERTDGSIPTLMSGAFLTIGTDRRDDTNWTGVGPPTFDGGVVQINVSGAAGQTITWDCFLQLFYRPRAVRPL